MSATRCQVVFGLQFRMRNRTPAAALVKQNDVIKARVEQTPVLRRNAAARPAMQENRRLGAARAGPLPIDAVTVANVQHAGLERLDFRVKGAGFRCHLMLSSRRVHFRSSGGQVSVS